ncbi:fibroblast growth factor 8-like [Actinia tenebrosa]|uniref:Fibroblast growth factor 8-like n=1 Tax=Actinia tenebrosa TaxID=6105 RepID=A0A6P8HFE4_ACTTE|nr:fibroblast growth factor 8-like [Actinia tenebrosa]
MARNMNIAWLPLLVILSISVQDSFEKSDDELLEQRFFEPMYKKGKTTTDPKSLPFRRVTQLYSRNSREHIRILPNRKIDAMGKDGDKYAKIIIESDNFGRVRIRGAATNYYLCIDKRGQIRARVKGRRKDNCIFREHFAENAFTEFTSVNKNNLYIAFNRRGRQRACNKTRSGMKAVQFIERPLRFQWLYKGRKTRKNKRNGQIEQGFSNQSQTICITVKSWREWRKYLKWRKQQKKLRRKRKSKLLAERKKVREMSTVVPPMIPRDSTTNPRISQSMSTRSSSSNTRMSSTKQ